MFVMKLVPAALVFPAVLSHSLLSFTFSSGSQKAARAASTVLCNMFQYKKLHRDYRLVSFMCNLHMLHPEHTLC